MSAPDIIRQLTATFANNLAAYKSGRFNEAQVRIQFINPMFEALGWDMANRAGYAEGCKEVVHVTGSGLTFGCSLLGQA